MNTKEELVEKIDNDYPNLAFVVVQAIIHAVDREGWLRNPGEPIDPKDIRKGDRVRVEYSDGDSHEYKATGREAGGGNRKYFLLDRPKQELPTEPVEHDRLWWIENANLDDAEDCEACNESHDLCPVHHGIALGMSALAGKMETLLEDYVLVDLPDSSKGSES